MSTRLGISNFVVPSPSPSPSTGLSQEGKTLADVEYAKANGEYSSEADYAKDVQEALGNEAASEEPPAGRVEGRHGLFQRHVLEIGNGPR